MAAESDLAKLVQLLTAKANNEISGNGVEAAVPEFDGSGDIKKWFENFEANAIAYGWTKVQKFVFTTNKLTKIAKVFLQTIKVTSYEELKLQLIEEFGKQCSSAEIHDQMRTRKKKTVESFHEYMIYMRQMGAKGNVDKKSIIRYIVDGVNGKPEYKIAMYGADDYVELRKQHEIFEHLQLKSHYVGTKQNYENNQKKEHCFNCGSSDHKRNQCTVAPKCFRCNEHGHISNKCPRPLEKKMNRIVESKRIKAIALNGVKIECLVDTGADVSVVKQSIIKKLNKVVLAKSQSVLRGLGNTRTHPIGEIMGEVIVDGIAVLQRFVVIPDAAIEHDALMGYDFIDRFHFTCDENGFNFSRLISAEKQSEPEELSMCNITETNINFVVPPQYAQEVSQMVTKYAPRPEMKCPIELTIIPDGQIRHFHHSPSRLSPEEAEAVRKQVEEWLKDGVVRKSTSFVASRVVIVRKKCGTPRICVDYRDLNKMVLKDRFPVPLIDDILLKLQSAVYFTVMDLENGFFHVPIDEASKKYTAFTIKEGLFEFNVAPFGFCNSPAAFIRFVNHIFQNLINENVLELYMDDIIVFGVTAEECLGKVKRALSHAERYNLKIKWKKCCFMQRRVNFLGHVVEDGKVWPGAEKINAVKQFKSPQNVRGVQSFLGLTGFFRKFIQGYSNIARPLTDLLKKDAVFKIGPEESNAIEQLKKCLTTQPVLRIYNREAETELCTDASKDGFGATLMQRSDGKFHPVLFWSRKTSTSESNRHSYILEAKAAFLAMKKFRNYLLPIKFKLVTDCAALKQTLTNKKEVPRAVTEWVFYMQDFAFEVEYRPGEKMKHADFLSRYPQDIYCTSTDLIARIRHAQQRDDQLKAVAEIIKDRPYENYKIKGGLIYKHFMGYDLLVIPRSMENEIIRDTHNVGHFATRKTIHAIQQKYWISHLEKKVKQAIANCIQCIMHNKKLGKAEGFLNCIEKGDLPLHTIHVDHLGPMDNTAKQYKYIFAIVDGFTKFVWLYPTRSTGSDEVIRKLTDWSNIFGNTTRIVSDQGAAFTSNAFKSFVEINKIDHILTTTGVARGNGQIERVNRSILAIIAKLSNNEPTKWFKFVPNVQAAINKHIHSSTKVSPFQLLFGVRMNREIDDRILQMLEEEILTEFDNERNKLRESARQQIMEAQEAYKKNYDKKRKEESVYKLGDLVAIKRTQFVAGRKLASQYIGPYEVTKVKRNGRYDVKKAAQTEGPNVTSTSCDNMKLWKYITESEELSSSGTDDEESDGRM